MGGGACVLMVVWRRVCNTQTSYSIHTHTHHMHMTNTNTHVFQYKRTLFRNHTSQAEVGDLLGMEEPEVPRGLGPVSISCERYDSMMDVVDSDHKPVYVMLRVEMNTWDEVRLDGV